MLVLLTPAPGSADTYLAHSNPEGGATLAQGPVHLRPVTKEGNHDRVAWQTLLSGTRLRTSGTPVSGVRTSVGPAPFHETPPPPAEAASAGLLLLGLALGLGGLFARGILVLVPGPTGTALRLLLLRVARGGVLMAIAASVAPLALDLIGAGETPSTASMSYDVRWGVREVGLALLLSGLSGRRDTVDLAPSRGVFLTGAFLATVGTAALGPTAATDQPVELAVLALHLAAALTWAGSVACLGIALLRGHRALPRPYVLAALRRFARPAGACLAVTAVTGVFVASDTIGSVDAALRTTYGRSFLLKLLLVVLAWVLALVNHRRLRRRSQTRVPTRIVAIEGLVAVLIVLVTSVVVSGQPATEPQLIDRGPAATLGPLAGRFADLQESFDLRPNRHGAATAVVSVFDTRRPSPGPVTAVSVRLGTDHPVPASVVGDGTWAARLPGLTEGPVGIEVRVTRAGAPTVTAHYGWSVAPTSRPEPRLVSRAPLHAVLRWVALVLAVGFAGAGAELLRRRRVRERPLTQLPGADAATRDPEKVLAGRA